MNKITICLFILFSFAAQARWEEVVTNTTEDLKKVEVIGNTAFVVGNNGVMLKSTDKGVSWSLINSSTTNNITNLIFVNSNLGFFSTATGEIFKTTNGGSTWLKTQVHQGGLNSVTFYNENIGLTAGDNGNIYRTINGGASWENLGSLSIFTINDLVFLNDKYAVAVGPSGNILVSDDLGLTWSSTPANNQYSFTAIEKINNKKAAVVTTNGFYAEIDTTSLQVAGFVKVDAESDWLSDITYVAFEEGTKGRIFTTGFNSSINVTNNNAWKTWDIDSTNNISGVHFFNDTIGVVVGQNGKIYRTETAGFPVSSPTIKKQKLSLYPNPTVNFVTVSNDFINANFQLTTVDGKIVKSGLLTNPTLFLGDIKSGLYVLTIITDHNYHEGKVVVK